MSTDKTNAFRTTGLAVLFAMSLGACAMMSGQETPGQYVDDATITAKVKQAFVADPAVKAAQIHVETMQGTVQLSGFVDAPSSESRAVDLAHRVNGVKSVEDDIIVRTADQRSR